LAAVGNGPGTVPPTPAMKRFADSLARQKGIEPPPGYKTSISICRKFLNEHAPMKSEGETPGKLDSKPVSPAQMLYAKKIAQGKGVVIPEEAKLSCPLGSAAGAVARPPTIRRDQLRLKRRRRRRGRGNAKLTLLPLHRLPRTQIQLLVRRCGFEAWRPLWLGWMVCPTRS
jgi:DNA topoisomerase III